MRLWRNRRFYSGFMVPEAGIPADLLITNTPDGRGKDFPGCTEDPLPLSAVACLLPLDEDDTLIRRGNLRWLLNGKGDRKGGSFSYSGLTG